MAYIYKRVGGRKTEKFLAELDGVQGFMQERIEAAALVATAALAEHRQDGHSFIEVDHGDIDWYLTLSDERGDKAAMSIEFGRAAGEREVIDKRTGELRVQRWGAAEGLFILHDALNLTRKHRAKVKVKNL